MVWREHEPGVNGPDVRTFSERSGSDQCSLLYFFHVYIYTETTYICCGGCGITFGGIKPQVIDSRNQIETRCRSK